MPTDLHEQLAAELGISPAEAEQALDDLLDDVKDRIRSGDEVVLQGLGTFSMDEGTLDFTPSPQLQKAVNYRNDHLAPLTIGESPEPSPLPPEEQEAPEEEPERPEEEPEAERPEEEEFAPIEPPVSEEESAETPEEAVVTETPLGEPEDVADLSDDWAEELEEEAPPSSPPSKDHPSAEELGLDESSAPNTAQVVGLVASLLLLVFLVWFVLGSQGLITGPGALLRSASSPAPTGADTVAAASSPTDAAPTDTAAPSTTAADTAGAERPSASSSMPPTIDRAMGGWTIVVASRTSPTEAKNTLEQYQQRFQGEGLPVDILTGTSDGQTRYRISVGQYDSRQAALNALGQLQGRVPEDAWPLQITANS